MFSFGAPPVQINLPLPTVSSWLFPSPRVSGNAPLVHAGRIYPGSTWSWLRTCGSCSSLTTITMEPQRFPISASLWHRRKPRIPDTSPGASFRCCLMHSRTQPGRLSQLGEVG